MEQNQNQRPERPPQRRPLTEEERRRLAARRRAAGSPPPARPRSGAPRPSPRRPANTPPPRPASAPRPHPQRKQPNLLYKIVDFLDENQTTAKRVALLAGVALVLIVGAIVIVAILNGGEEPPLDTSDYVFSIGDETLTVPYAEAVLDKTVYLDLYALCDYCGLTVSGTPDALKFAADEDTFLIFYRGQNAISVCGVRAEMSSPALFGEKSLLVPLDFLRKTVSGLEITRGSRNHDISIVRATNADGSAKPIAFTADTATLTVAGKPVTVSFSTDLSRYEIFMNPPGDDYLLLINKTHPIGEDFAPDDLSLIPAAYTTKELELRLSAAKALEAMFLEMYRAGFTSIKATSAYRSFRYQASLFNTYINEEIAKDPKLSVKEASEIVATYSAVPGTSEHHSGLCVDLINAEKMVLDESFADEPVYEWLRENAWKFGFVLRFPEGKTDITGYTYEPWHYRFVGRYHAAQIQAADVCLEEYLNTIAP